MKIYKYIFVGLAALFITSCEDDDVVVDPGNPLNRNMINLEATVSTETTLAGESDVISFTVEIPQTFDTDVTVTARARFDNGSTTIGSATIPAGSTSGTGTITLPGDDGAQSGNLLGISEFGSLTLVGIQLDELESGNTYTITSNEATFGVLDRTLGVAGGLNLLFDWEGAPATDLDMYVFDANTFEQLESAETGDRYEVDLFQNAGRPDGDYLVAVAVYENGTDEATTDIDYLFAFTKPTGMVDIYTGTLEQVADFDGLFVLATFTKTTDPETGTVSYTTASAN